MQTQREQSWRIRVTAKARNFNFRFRFRFTPTSFTPSWTLSSYHLSIVLKLRKLVLRINSQPSTPPIIAQPKNVRGFIRAKVMKIVHKFQARLSKNRPSIAAKRETNLAYPKDLIRIGFWVVGFLAFLAQSIIKNYQKGIVMLASVVGFFFASLLFKKFKTVKVGKLATFSLVVATIVCYLLFYFDKNYWDYMGRSPWNKIGSL